jgi:hypothetical protein
MECIGIIYMWTNVDTKKSYTGQTRSCSSNNFITDCDGLLYHRFKGHCSDSKRGSETYFHRALEKYGPDKFVPTILSMHQAESIEQLIKILDEEEEKNIIQLDTLAPNGYNLSSGGSSPIFHIDTRKKMSEKKQAFLSTEEGKLWIKSIKEAKALLYSTEKGKQQAKNHGEVISSKYKAEPELIEKIRQSVILYNDSPEGKERRTIHSEWMKNFMDTPEGNVFKQHLSECAKKRWEDESYRTKQIFDGKTRFEGEEGRKRKESLSKKATERLNDPEKRKNASEKTKAYFDRVGRKLYHCEKCNQKCRDKTAYEKHCKSKTHLNKGIAVTISKPSLAAPPSSP